MESTLRVDSSDQIQIRIFEIHNLSVFGGETDAVHVWYSYWTYVGGALLILSH